MIEVNPKPVKTPVKKENRFFHVIGKVIDFFEWDARRSVVSIIIGMFLIFGALQLSMLTWQYWIFLIGMSSIIITIFMRGALFGGASERKIHDATFMCIPKDVLMKQAEMQKLMHEAHHQSAKKDDDDKMPN